MPESETTQVTDDPQCRELSTLNRKVDDHIQEYRNHMTEYQDRQRKQETASLELTAHVTALTKATKPLVDTAVTLSNLQRFCKWAGGLTLVAVFLIWVLKQILEVYIHGSAIL